ncbi:MAG: hypothetical protein PWQ68_1832 [Thermoanaerobacteraceae bacterium]|jgi:hypothetical protein|nr:hypothetical protein [Thermoanaerobacteraceae bacterium]
MSKDNAALALAHEQFKKILLQAGNLTLNVE